MAHGLVRCLEIGAIDGQCHDGAHRNRTCAPGSGGALSPSWARTHVNCVICVCYTPIGYTRNRGTLLRLCLQRPDGGASMKHGCTPAACRPMSGRRAALQSARL